MTRRHTKSADVCRFGLTEQERNFVQNVFSDEYKTLKQASVAARYSEKTNAGELLRRAGCQAYLRQLRRYAQDKLVNKYLNNSLDMLEVLIGLAKDPNETSTTRISAARAVLDYGQKSYAVTVQDAKMEEIEARLDALNQEHQ